MYFLYFVDIKRTLKSSDNLIHNIYFGGSSKARSFILLSFKITFKKILEPFPIFVFEFQNCEISIFFFKFL